MRVLVAPGPMGPIPADLAGAAIAEGWRDVDSTVDIAVVPCADAGAGFVDTVGAVWGALPTVFPAGTDEELVSCVQSGDRVAMAIAGRYDSGFDPTRSSTVLGQALHEVLLQQKPNEVVLDLTGLASHDGGAGFLAALGAQANVPLTEGVSGLSGLSRIDLTAVHEILAGVALVGVMPVAEERHLLLGLRGITSRRGADLGLDPQLMLSTDANLETLATLVSPQAAQLPGAGACGGLGWAIAALGGRIIAGVDLVGEWSHAGATARQADVVVTGTSTFDFHHKGGGVVNRVAGWAIEALRPCLVLAGDVMISDREMRLMGIEAAYPVALNDPEALRASASRIARSWTWR